MKKFLSLVLALVMTMSLVTVSAGAKDFTDNGKINYDEAVAVMSAVKVIDGYTDGSFNPQGSLTRGAAAKIICNLILGPTTAAELHADTAPYKDVTVDHTFAGYISYCAKEGIISGYADGTFRPAAPLTGYAFMKMLLGALGYDTEIEGFVGANWSINVAKRALAIGLNKGLKGDFNGVKAVTREEACLYALNTLTATMVDYDAKITANVNGAQVIVGNSVANDVKWNIASKADGNIKDDGYVQFAEKYFEKLELEIGNGIYGRPSNIWKNKKAEIGSFTSIEATKSYTEDTKQKDIYKDLGKAVCDTKEYDWTVYVNGKEEKTPVVPKNVSDKYGYTGEGAVVEIYVNDDDATVTVCEINYYLGQVTKVKTDDDGEYINVKVLSDGAKVLDDKTFHVEGYEEDDYVVFTMDYQDKDFVIGEVIDPETVTGAVTRVDNDKKDSEINNSNEYSTYLKMDGEKYVYTEADHMVYDVEKLDGKHPVLDDEYMLFLDPNGYVLGFKVTAESVAQYLYVKDSDEELKDWIAKVELPDGSSAKVDLKDELDNAAISAADFTHPQGLADNGYAKDAAIQFIDADQNTKTYTNIDQLIWKYSVDKNGVYKLAMVKPFDSKHNNNNAGVSQFYLGAATIENGEPYINGTHVKGGTSAADEMGFIVDKKTVFVDTVNDVTYTGYNEVPNVENAEVAYVLNGKVAEVVFILDGDIYDEGNTYFIVADRGERNSFTHDGDTYWEYVKTYVNGEKQSLNVKYGADKSSTKELLEDGVLYQVKKTIDEDYITEVVKVELAGKKLNVWTAESGAFWLAGDKDNKTPFKYTCDDETVFVVVDTTADGLKIFQGDEKDLVATDDLYPTNEDGDYTVCDVAVLDNDGRYAKMVFVWRTEVPAAGSDKENGNVGDMSNVTLSFNAKKNAVVTFGMKNLDYALADVKVIRVSDAGVKSTIINETGLALTGAGENVWAATTEGVVTERASYSFQITLKDREGDVMARFVADDLVYVGANA